MNPFAKKKMIKSNKQSKKWNPLGKKMNKKLMI